MKIELRSDRPMDDAAREADTGVMVKHDQLQARADGLRRAWGESLGRLKTIVEG